MDTFRCGHCFSTAPETTHADLLALIDKAIAVAPF